MPDAAVKLVLAPAFPLDARIRSVMVDGRDASFEIERIGDVQRAVVRIDDAAARVDAAAPAPSSGAAAQPQTARRIIFVYDEGTEVYTTIEPPARGAASEGLRILRSRAQDDTLRLTLEGLGGRTYPLGVRSSRSVGEAPGVTVTTSSGRTELRVWFEGPPGQYVRRTIDLPLR